MELFRRESRTIEVAKPGLEILEHGMLLDGLEDEKFVEAFTYVQNTIEGKSGFLTLFLPDRRFKRDCKYIHGM